MAGRGAQDARTTARQAMQSLREGNAAVARAAFESLVAAAADDASACLGLALACRALGDGEGALAAVDRALAHEPRNLRALIFKGDILDFLGDRRAASSFYLAAVSQARAAGEVSADLRPDLARAQA
ncbi:MAG TPA: tetratricopeptide repeat protein, partial [Usitatibacteraceae bacterium]|nr:tetratricopeptide repeat protein [Usitatibacteraceae bacterium]